jgi:hypothetical protein
MALSPSEEVAIRPATQEFPNILRNPKVHYHFHKEPATDLYPKPDESRSCHSVPFLEDQF